MQLNKKIEFQTRERDAKKFEYLAEHNKGSGYCAAWFSRRLFPPVQISEVCSSHFGLGLDSYVQWSSPIRRLSDLQVNIYIYEYFFYLCLFFYDSICLFYLFHFFIIRFKLKKGSCYD